MRKRTYNGDEKRNVENEQVQKEMDKESDKKSDKETTDKSEHSFRKYKRLKMAVSIGLSAGVIWGIFSFVVYYMQFTDVGPSIYATPFLNPDYELKWQGHIIGVGFFIVYSIIFSEIYVFLLLKFKTPFAGVVYGLLLWSFVFLILNPIFDFTKSVKELGLNTNSTMISLYMLAGLFIGYSLSIEFNSEDKT